MISLDNQLEWRVEVILDDDVAIIMPQKNGGTQKNAY